MHAHCWEPPGLCVFLMVFLLLHLCVQKKGMNIEKWNVNEKQRKETTPKPTKNNIPIITQNHDFRTIRASRNFQNILSVKCWLIFNKDYAKGTLKILNTTCIHIWPYRWQTTAGCVVRCLSLLCLALLLVVLNLYICCVLPAWQIENLETCLHIYLQIGLSKTSSWYANKNVVAIKHCQNYLLYGQLWR